MSASFSTLDEAKTNADATATAWKEVDNRFIPEGTSDVFVCEEQAPESTEDRVQLALELILVYGGIDGAHHKTWVLDQVARMLLGDGYEKFVENAKAGEDGPDTYDWDEGIAP